MPFWTAASDSSVDVREAWPGRSLFPSADLPSAPVTTRTLIGAAASRSASSSHISKDPS
ncbi:hypothetical protein HMPREF9056_00735 [Actinomyces sp. oral taxon 170 str. F0386]|nr:hypothetical protein HMPREF9056_00735 [Actinomyces sp. oral taxon 170 str. F0386]